MDLVRENELVVLSSEQLITGFDCGNDDLNDFFNHDAIKYRRQKLAETWFFRHNTTKQAVCAFSLSPDSIKAMWLPGSRRKKIKEFIPRDKPLSSYPAFLIGRLGVSAEFANRGMGSQLLRFIKQFCDINYTSFCRFLLVEAYNEPSVLNFYLKNDFNFVFSTEEQERDYYKRANISEPLRTRIMFYDMIHWENQ
ncbi:MAG: N-acetyltransferase [Prevotellaceae bacterium]|jgi:ribosomal protein S18 acetylase RimI-like enzyme|nr:N-acetyltransferase [Prevotellaceae bacterium]